MMSNNYPEGYGFFYIQLVRKADMKEVYSSPLYGIDNSDAMDRDKISARLNYYFDRINSGIKQQLESPKLTPEQKASLKLINKADYYALLRIPGVGPTSAKTLVAARKHNILGFDEIKKIVYKLLKIH